MPTIQKEVLKAARYFRESNRLIGIKEPVAEKLLTLAIIDGLTNLRQFQLDENDLEAVNSIKLSEHKKKRKKGKNKKKSLKPTNIFTEIYNKKEDALLIFGKKWHKPKRDLRTPQSQYPRLSSPLASQIVEPSLLPQSQSLQAS